MKLLRSGLGLLKSDVKRWKKQLAIGATVLEDEPSPVKEQRNCPNTSSVDLILARGIVKAAERAFIKMLVGTVDTYYSKVSDLREDVVHGKAHPIVAERWERYNAHWDCALLPRLTRSLGSGPSQKALKLEELTVQEIRAALEAVGATVTEDQIHAMLMVHRLLRAEFKRSTKLVVCKNL